MQSAKHAQNIRAAANGNFILGLNKIYFKIYKGSAFLNFLKSVSRK